MIITNNQDDSGDITDPRHVKDITDPRHVIHPSGRVGMVVNGTWYPLSIATRMLAQSAPETVNHRDLHMDSYEPYNDDYLSAQSKMLTKHSIFSKEIEYIHSHPIHSKLRCNNSIFGRMKPFDNNYSTDTKFTTGYINDIEVVFQFFELSNATTCLLASQQIYLYIINFIVISNYSPCFLLCIDVGACNKGIIDVTIEYRKQGIRELSKLYPKLLSEFIGGQTDLIGYTVTPRLQETLLDFLSNINNHDHIVYIIFFMIHVFEITSKIGLKHNDVTLSNILINRQHVKLCIQSSHKRFYFESDLLPFLLDFEKSAINHTIASIVNFDNPCTRESSYFCKQQKRCSNYDKSKRDLLIFLIRMYLLLTEFTRSNKKYLINERKLIDSMIFRDQKNEWMTYVNKYFEYNKINHTLKIKPDVSLTDVLMISLDDRLIATNISEPHTLLTSKSLYTELVKCKQFKINPSDASEYTLYTMDNRDIKKDHEAYVSSYKC